MNLSGVVAVSGKPGLFKVLGQNKAGFLLQGLEDGMKLMVSNNARLAALDETTVYGLEEDLLLKKILLDMQSKSTELTIPDPKSDPSVLRAFFEKICPDHDQERVYPSDLKKIVSWYRILEKLPLFNELDPKDEKENSKEIQEEKTGEEEIEKSKDKVKATKKPSPAKPKFSDAHSSDPANTKTGSKNVTHAVRKVNTGANKKAK